MGELLQPILRCIYLPSAHLYPSFRLIHTCHAAPLPFSDSAVSFVKVRVVSGNVRTASRTVKRTGKLLITTIRGTPRGSRKKPKAGRSPTCRLWTANANSNMPCRAHVVLCRSLEKSLLERHGRGMVCVNQTRPHCVNQVGNAHSKHSAARHDRRTAWVRHGNGMACG
jgi:hypothetical protein